MWQGSIGSWKRLWAGCAVVLALLLASAPCFSLVAAESTADKQKEYSS